MREGKDLALIATGSLVGEAMQCASLLEGDNISCEVVNFHTIKPIDIKKIEELSKKFKTIITLEEHNIIGGLGSAVAEVLSKVKSSTQQLFFGVNDTYSEGGEYEYLLDKFSLSANRVYEKIKKLNI